MSTGRGKDVVRGLRTTFEAGRATYEAASGYRETEARTEFIDPLLGALGWDVANEAGLIPSRREVVQEANQSGRGSAARRPDYTLRANGVARFHVEAKKPFVDVRQHRESIFQARRYGYTDRHALVVLTNYRDLVVYDATVPVDEDADLPETALLWAWSYTEFEDRWDEILDVLGREAVHAPGWEERFGAPSGRRLVPADEAFVAQLDRWRVALGRSILANAPHSTREELNDGVQRLLHQLVFVRMCEDRGIEDEATLERAFAGGRAEAEELFRRLGKRYGPFLFSAEGHGNDPLALVDFGLVREIVGRLYPPLSPFSFAVLDADFLGLVYESTLVRHLTVTPGADGRPVVALATKPEYEKRDVVTTPQRLVDVTVGEAVARLDPAVRRPRVLDFAVGSGRFLVGAFERLLEREAQARAAAGGTGLITVARDTRRLSYEEKRKLLVETVFGIDIDYNAVETARFSLLVRLLEGETKDTLPPGQGILPDLSDTIVHGNTLDREEPAGAGTLPDAFDLVVGNPPYMQTRQMKAADPAEFAYLKARYATAHQQFDKYFAFVESGVERLAAGGVLGVVVPNKWMTVVAGEKLRRLLRTGTTPLWLMNFRHLQVFPEKAVYVAALVVRGGRSDEPLQYGEPGSLEELALGRTASFAVTGPLAPTVEGKWVLPVSERERRVLEAVQGRARPLATVVAARNGVQTSRNPVYVLKGAVVRDGLVLFNRKDPDTGKVHTWAVEEGIVQPYLDDSTQVRSHHRVRPDAHIIFPYRPSTTGSGASGYEVIPERDMRRDFPRAYEYLSRYRAELDARNMSETERAKAFYIYGRTQAIGYCRESPKIFYSNNQRGDKYGLDETGIVYQSGGTGGEVALYRDGPFSLDFVLALLDQDEIEFFLRKRGSAFRDGYYARGTDVIGEAPVPDLDLGRVEHRAFHDEVSADMAELRAQHGSRWAGGRAQAQQKAAIHACRTRIRRRFLDWWGLTEEDTAGLLD